MSAAIDIESFSLKNIQQMKDEDIVSYHGSKKLELIAAEGGHINAVKNLISRGFDVDFEVDNESMASVAYKNKHNEVVLCLLQANARFPNNFNFNDATEELKAFASLSQSLHNEIKAENLEKIKEILNQNNLKYFYDLTNKSAMRTAIEGKKFEIIKILLESKVIIGPHEDIEEITRNYKQFEKRKLREIHTKLSSNVLVEPMTSLLQNSFVGPDVPKRKENLNFIHNTYDFLLNIPLIAIILEIVAASRNFTIIFDFNRDSVSFLDPTSDSNMNALFYFSGRIYVGAKDMLDPHKQFEMYSVIAHELCHYAMFLVFNNLSKPYYAVKPAAEKLFNAISFECMSRMECEEIVGDVYELYDEEDQHAELIVRVPQIYAFYHNQNEILSEKREIFDSLFKFYEENCVREMRKALPRIKKNNPSDYQRKIKRQRRVIFGLLILIVLILPVCGFLIHNPDLNWRDLNDEQKMAVKNSNLTYENVDFKVCDLFGDNLEIYESFNSDFIKSALKNDREELSTHLKSFNESLINLNWHNMTNSLKDRILTLNVNFQGKILKLSKVTNSKLKSDDLKNILKGMIKISKPLHLKSSIYVERNFTEKLFLTKFNADELTKDFNLILKEIEDSRIFLLSSAAGEGKSTTFRHFWFKLKEKFPSKWIQFVDLKKHIDAFENDFNDVGKFISDQILNLKNFEREIFIEKFNKSEVIFLWDGVDEIAPLFKKIFSDFVMNIKNSTNILQFISTRPLVFTSEEIQENFKATSYDFAPLSNATKVELLIKLIARNSNPNLIYESYKNNSLDSQLKDSISKGLKILTSLSIPSKIENISPLLIQMIVDVANNHKFHFNSTLNFYNFFETFIKEKLKIVRIKNSPVIGEDLDKFTRNENMMKAHKAYALKLLYNTHEPLVSKYFKKSTRNVENHEISRFGILNVYPDGDFDFNHRTFAEFFVAIFLIEKIDDFEGDSQNVVDIFNDAMISGGIIQKFMLGYDRWRDDEVKKVFERHLKVYKLSESENVNKFLSFVNFVSFFEGKGMKLDEIKLKIELNFNENDLKILMRIFNEIEEIFGDKIMKNFYSSRLADGENILHKFIESELINEFLTNMKRILTENEILNVLSTQDDQLSQNALMKSKKSLKIILNFITENLNRKSIKNLLNINTRFNLTALQLSSTSLENFKVMRKFYENYFTKEEIFKIITTFDINELPFIEICDDDSLDEVVNFLQEIFSNDTLALKNFLTHRNIHGDSIFSKYKDKQFPEVLKVIKEIFKNEEEFLKIKQRTFRLFEGLNKNSTKSQMDQVKLTPWNDYCAQFWVDNWENSKNQIGEENLRYLIMTQNKFNESIFSDLFLTNTYTNSPRGFFDKIKSTLSESDMKTLLKYNESTCEVSQLMLAGEYATLSDFKSLWDIFEVYFNNEELKKFIKEKNDKNSHTILHYATRNKNPKVFKFVSEIYFKFNKIEELRKLFTQMTDKGKIRFFKNLIANKKTYKTVMDFMYEIFNGDKHQLSLLMKNLSLASKVDIVDVLMPSNTRVIVC